MIKRIGSLFNKLNSVFVHPELFYFVEPGKLDHNETPFCLEINKSFENVRFLETGYHAVPAERAGGGVLPPGRPCR
jgi:hypothetical protein